MTIHHNSPVLRLLTNLLIIKARLPPLESIAELNEEELLSAGMPQTVEQALKELQDDLRRESTATTMVLMSQAKFIPDTFPVKKRPYEPHLYREPLMKIDWEASEDADRVVYTTPSPKTPTTPPPQPDTCPKHEKCPLSCLSRYVTVTSPTTPAKRGRGRPPKPQRGRPRKIVLDSPSPKNQKPTSCSEAICHYPVSCTCDNKSDKKPLTPAEIVKRDGKWDYYVWEGQFASDAEVDAALDSYNADDYPGDEEPPTKKQLIAASVMVPDEVVDMNATTKKHDNYIHVVYYQ